MPNHQDNHGSLGTVAEWAQDASTVNQSRTNTSGPAGELNNEKSVPRGAYDEAPSPIQPIGSEAFPSLDTTLESLPDSSINSTSITGARKATFPTNLPPDKVNTGFSTQGSQKKRRRGTTKGSKKGFSASDDLLSREDAEELLDLVQGHLVVFPYDWLVREELNSNWLYQVDQVAPLQIYN